MTGRLLRYARNDVSRNKATIGLSVIASGVQRSAANQINKLPFWIASFLAMTRSDNKGSASLRSRLFEARVGAKPRGFCSLHSR